MAPHASKAAAPAANPPDDTPIGPPSGISSIPTQYMSEQAIRQMLKSVGNDEAREDNYRLKGVQLIDSVRESLQLPVRTFDTAAVYYHRFRIRFPSTEYNFEDVAVASLFVACKVEDTIKKSKDILCAAHNLRHPHDQKTPDDKQFESPSRFTVGLERHILETIGFDFRAQYPQKLLVKLVKKMFAGQDPQSSQAKEFFAVAYDMSIDLFKTFAPIKQSTFTLVLAILELTVLITGADVALMAPFKDGPQWHSAKLNVREAMLDLMDLYTLYSKQTKIGTRFELAKLMDVKIEINKTMPSQDKAERYHIWCDKCALEGGDSHPVTPGSARSPATSNSFSGSGSVRRKGATNEGTLRFVFDADEARRERDLAARHFDDEYEEYEVEVEEPIPEEPRGPSRNNAPLRSQGHNSHDRGWRPYQHQRGRNDRHPGHARHGY